MWCNASAPSRRQLPIDEELPPYSAVAPQMNQPGRQGIPPNNAGISMADRPPPPRYEHPPNYSRIPKYYTPPPPHHERLPSYVPSSGRSNTPVPRDTPPLCAVQRRLRSLPTLDRETLGEHAYQIAVLWTTGDGQQVRIYCRPMLLRIFGDEHGRAIWDDLDSCASQMQGLSYAASARLAILGS
jgi:hypothetical protein